MSGDEMASTIIILERHERAMAVVEATRKRRAAVLYHETLTAMREETAALAAFDAAGEKAARLDDPGRG